MTDDLEEAMTWVEEAVAAKEPKSVALVGNAAEILPRLVALDIVPDVVTDQTSAHDPMYGYIPAGLSLAEADALRESDPDGLFAPRHRFDDHPRAGDARLAEEGRHRL